MFGTTLIRPGVYSYDSICQNVTMFYSKMSKILANICSRVVSLSSNRHITSKVIAPNFQFRRWILNRGLNSTNYPASEGTTSPARDDYPNKSSPRRHLSKAHRDFLSSALRVNQAGELAATLIYKAQTNPLVSAYPHLRPLIKHMHDQENGHFQIFNKLLAKHRVRPTIMYPIWTLAATALGWGTAVMGREAAMACTEAIETEIGSHYNSQVRELLGIATALKSQGEELGSELENLIETIRRVRDEELEHLDHAVENDAHKAVPHDLLTGAIRAGCRGAIWISERV